MHNMKCLDLLKKVLVVATIFFSFNLLSKKSLECVSMKNQGWKLKEEVINVNIKNPVLILLVSF